MNATTETLALGMTELSDSELRNLKYHLEKKTPVICGTRAMQFTESGCGCPAFMATTRRIPPQEHLYRTDGGLGSKCRKTWEKFGGPFGTIGPMNEPNTAPFLQALREAKPVDVRKAIQKVLELRGI